MHVLLTVFKGATFERHFIDTWFTGVMYKVPFENIAAFNLQKWYWIKDAWPFLLLLTVLVLILGIALLFSQLYNWSLRRKIEKTILFDKFTGLPKISMLKSLLQKKKYTESFGALVYFDVKGLRVFNETYGYLYGDEILLGIAREIAPHKQITGSFHLQEDSFAVLFSGNESREAVKEIMEEMFCSLQSLTAGKGMSLQFACGILMLNETNINNVDVLLDNVGFAHERAKCSAQTKIIFFDEKEKNLHISRCALSGELRKATLQGELVLEFQPKFSLKDGTLAGAEALIRWQHPERGLMMPADFVLGFEEDGMIEIMDQYVMKNVLDNVMIWRKKGLRVPVISVNLSGVNMSNSRMADTLISVVKKYNLPDRTIELELTESAFSGTLDELISTMQKLRKAGFLLSLDDFGTGFSSLSHLRVLPLDTVKLDKCFLDGIQNNQKLQRFVKDIINMSKNMGMQTIIEGVENGWEARFVRDAGCDLVQGFWFSSPLSQENFTRLLYLGDRQKQAACSVEKEKLAIYS